MCTPLNTWCSSLHGFTPASGHCLRATSTRYLRQAAGEAEGRGKRLEAKVNASIDDQVDIKALLDKGVNNLLKLDYLYETADTEKKRDIISSMYPEKLTFDGFSLWTTRINEVIRIIYSMGEGFSENKNRTNGNKSSLSCKVGLLGFEPRKTESKSVVLPLHHNPINIPKFSLGLQI